jgi:hypothetical protein
VRIKLGNLLYDGNLALVSDPAAKEAVDETKFKNTRS